MNNSQSYWPSQVGRYGYIVRPIHMILFRPCGLPLNKRNDGKRTPTCQSTIHVNGSVGVAYVNPLQKQPV